MHTRFAALFLGLGFADLAYVDLALGPEIFGSKRAEQAVDAAEPDTLARVPQAPSAPTALPLAASVNAIEPAVVAQPKPAVVAQPTSGALPPEIPQPALPTPAPSDDEPRAPPSPSEPTADQSEWVVHFPGTNTADLPEDANDMLTEVARQLEAEPRLRVSVTGHADARGTREYNLDLGGRRARSVAAALKRAGVSAGQLQIKSRGEDEPRALGATEENWAQNRRVEIAIHTRRSQTP